jgi:hypothetical protein
LRADEERIATLLVSVFDSEEDLALSLEGDAAQIFIDVVQNVGSLHRRPCCLHVIKSFNCIQALDRGFLMDPQNSRRARRIIRKLSEVSDNLPSSLYITGVTGREEYPTSGGGFADIYRSTYNNQTVALKHIRHFLRGADVRRTRLVSLAFAIALADN